MRAQCERDHPGCDVRVVEGASLEDLKRKTGQREDVFERRRWEMERGEGGDHDKPYTYRSPSNWGLLDQWLVLLARYHRGELES